MRRFRIEATWSNEGVQVMLLAIEPLAPKREKLLRERGMLKADDDPVAQRHIGEIDITDPGQMTNKRVRRAALGWLADHAGMTDQDSYEMQIAVRADLEALARLEAAVSG